MAGQKDMLAFAHTWVQTHSVAGKAHEDLVADFLLTYGDTVAEAISNHLAIEALEDALREAGYDFNVNGE
jgi:hypothetical protein